MNDSKIKKAAALLLGKTAPLIVSHISPDGDTLGSALALTHALQALGQAPQPVVDDAIPANLFFLPGFDLLKTPRDISGKPDLVVLVDCASLERSGGCWLSPYLAGVPLLVIDHHAVGDISGDVEIIDAQAAATGELIYLVLKEMGVTLSREIAVCLYAALVSDTGGFRFNSTTPETFAIAGELLACGVDLQEISNNIFERRTKKNAYLYGVALQNLEQSEDLLLAWTYLDLAVIDSMHADGADTANMSNTPMLLPGVVVGATFEEREDCVKISLRCHRGFDVAEVASRFGGGGHAAAAGATVNGRLAQVMPEVLAALRMMIDQRRSLQ